MLAIVAGVLDLLALLTAAEGVSDYYGGAGVVAELVWVAAVIGSGVLLLTSRRTPDLGSGAVVGVALASLASTTALLPTFQNEWWWYSTSYATRSGTLSLVAGIAVTCAGVLAYAQRPTQTERRRPAPATVAVGIAAASYGLARVLTTSFWSDGQGLEGVPNLVAVACLVGVPILATFAGWNRLFSSGVVFGFALLPITSLITRSGSVLESGVLVINVALLVALGIVLLIDASPRSGPSPAPQT